MGHINPITLNISNHAIRLGLLHWLESGRKLIKYPLSFKAKFDPISSTIPFQEPLISWITMHSFVSAWPGCPTKSISHIPDWCRDPEFLTRWRNKVCSWCCGHISNTYSLLFESEIMTQSSWPLSSFPFGVPPTIISLLLETCRTETSIFRVNKPGPWRKWTVCEWRTCPQEKRACKVIFLLHNPISHAIS